MSKLSLNVDSQRSLALVVEAYGEPQSVSVKSVARAKLVVGQVRVAVRASGVNFADVMAIRGQHQNTPPVPFTPGFECAGEVIEVASDVKKFQVGDKVVVAFGHGSHQAEAIAPVTQVFPIPANMDFSTAAAFPVAFGTAYTALKLRAALRPGETLLVTGGTGNIGSSAVQVGKLIGARVIGSSRGEHSVASLKDLGADYTIVSSKENVRERVLEITAGRGVDVVFDPVLGSTFTDVLAAIAPLGRYIPIGASSGDIPEISLLMPLMKNISVVGVDWDWHLHHDLPFVEEAMTTLLSWFGRGWLKPQPVQVKKLAEAAAVLTAVAQGTAHGKQILLP